VDRIGLADARLAYAERDFFQTNEGSSRLAVRLRWASAYAAAFSLPCSMSLTGSEGATQFLALTLYTDACTPCPNTLSQH
jgi:hypothetical protein